MFRSFTPPSAEFSEKYQLLYNVKSHGTNGPLPTSYAGMISAVDLPVKEVSVATTFIYYMSVTVCADLAKSRFWSIERSRMSLINTIRKF